MLDKSIFKKKQWNEMKYKLSNRSFDNKESLKAKLTILRGKTNNH